MVEVGDRIKQRYLIQEKLGQGGMSEVYAVLDERMEKPFAIKLLLPQWAKNPQLVRQFCLEATAAGRIKHPNVVEIDDVDEHEGVPYLRMEKLYGKSLRQRLDENGPFAPAEALQLMIPVVRGMDAAHRKGVVHRDLKPDNIFLCEDADGKIKLEPKVLDFGISRLTGHESVYAAASVMGTPAYMPPEVIRDEPSADHRVDIYALGVILYEMLSGTLPFPDENLGELIVSAVSRSPEPLSSRVRGIDADLERVVMRAMSASVESRFEDVASLLAELQDCAARLGSVQAPVNPTDACKVCTICVVPGLDKEKRQSLCYVPDARAGASPAPSEIKPLVLQSDLNERLKRVEATVIDLVELALAGRARGSTNLEAPARELARLVLPKYGLQGLTPPGTHAQLDIDFPMLSAIPWEVFEQESWTCENRHVWLTAKAFCDKCGKPVQAKVEKVVLQWRLSHLVRGAQSGAEGKRDRFLIVMDPRGDLCAPENDPDEFCWKHHEILEELLRAAGYDVVVLAGESATKAEVHRFLHDPLLAGVYCFCHGDSSQSTSGLLLHDATLYAEELSEIRCSAGLAFINACWGAAPKGEWDPHAQPLSVATEFAKTGERRVAIAPMWPVVNRQAAQMALDFFKAAVAQRSCGEALQEARRNSHDRYLEGEPDTCWMAYRYYGGPNSKLPPPTRPIDEKQPVTPTARGVAPAPREAPTRIWDRDLQLMPELFRFPVEDVFRRVLARASMERRSVATVNDLVAALVSQGALTRYALHRHGLSWEQVKELASTLMTPAVTEDVTRDDEDLASSQTVLASDLTESSVPAPELPWPVTQRSLHLELVRLLEAADQARQKQSGDPRITERDVLEAALASKVWSALAATVSGLPSVDEAKAALNDLGQVDDDGRLTLSKLDERSRAIVEAAHQYACRIGEGEVTQRLLLAAFLDDEDGFAAKAFGEANLDPGAFQALMFAAAHSFPGERRQPLDAILSYESAQRTVLPMCTSAAEKKEADRVSEEELFRAFCRTASDAFKAWLREGVLMSVDLDQWAQRSVLESYNLEPDARELVEQSLATSNDHGRVDISNRILLYHFLSDLDGPIGQLLRSSSVAALQAARDWCLKSQDRDTPKRLTLTPSVCDRAVTPMLRRAKRLSQTGTITLQELFLGFCEASPPEFKQVLRDYFGVDLARDFRSSRGVTSSDAGRARRVGVGQPKQPSRALTQRNAAAIARCGQFQATEFSTAAWELLLKARELARSRGSALVRSPHLVAAMVDAGRGPLGSLFGEQAAVIQDLVLQMVPAEPVTELADPLFNQSTEDLVRRALEKAANQRRPAEPDDLRSAFLEDGGGKVGQALRQAGVNLPRLH